MTTVAFQLAGDEAIDKVGLTPDRLIKPILSGSDELLDAAVTELPG